MGTLAFLRGNRSIWLAMLLVCLIVLELNYYREDAHVTHAHVPFRQSAGGSMTPMRMQQIRINSSLTDKLRNFETPDIEQIYLLETLLTKKHSFNDDNVEIFRNDLRRKMESYFNNYLVIDQENTPLNHTFTFGSTNKSYAVEISEEIHKLLPDKVTYEDIPRCSVVGNSGSILNSSCGKEIDEADFVFRCNAAPIRAFAGDAGNKTNFTSFNPSILRTRYQKLSKPDSVSHFLQDMKEYRELLRAPCFSSQAMKQCIEVLKTYNISENKFVLGHPRHFQKVQEFWKKCGLKKRITTGLYLTTAALNRCRKVHLFGFWPYFQTVRRTIKDIPYHYFDKAKYNFSDKHGIHNMHAEFSVLVQLHNLGVLKIHVGECNQ